MSGAELTYLVIVRRQFAASAVDVFRVMLIFSIIKPTRSYLKRERVAQLSFRK